MIDSLRRITLASLAVVALVFVVSVASSDFSLCKGGIGCVASVTLSQVDAGTIGQSTPQFASASSLVALNEVVRVVSLGGLLALIIALLVLELAKPRFFKVFLRHGFAR